MSHTSPALGELLDWKGGWLTGTSEYFDTGKCDGGWEAGLRPGEEVFLVHSSWDLRIKIWSGTGPSRSKGKCAPGRRKAWRLAQQPGPDLPDSSGFSQSAGSHGRLRGSLSAGSCGCEERVQGEKRACCRPGQGKTKQGPACLPWGFR